MLRWSLHKFSDPSGYLQTNKLDPTGPDMDLLCQVLADEPSGLLSETNSTTLVIDCGATSTTMFDEADFKLGTLQLFEHGEQAPIQGITGTLPIKGQGTISLQVINNEGEIVNIDTQAYYILELHTKLFSPQAYFHECNDNSELIIKCDNALMQLIGYEQEKTHEITFSYNPQTRLPMMCAYRNALLMAKALALTTCLTDK